MAHQLGQDNITGKLFGYAFDIHNPVFLISAISIMLFVLLALVMPETATNLFGWLRGTLTSNFDWFFILSADAFVLFCVTIALSPWGKVRIGGTDAVPDFSTISWFALLFAAGVGIGLMFFGALEPVFHMGVSRPLGTPPLLDDQGGFIASNIEQAKYMGIGATMYHWGLHPWAIYGVVALALALAAYNRGLPLSIRSAFHPLFGDRIWGPLGHLIDTLAVFAALFGLATSLGLGAQQANAGLHHVFGVASAPWVQVILIVVITGLAITSVLRGMVRGVKLLSQINVMVAALLLVFVLFAGPTLAILADFVQSLVIYAQKLPALASPIGREDTAFREDWTSFYWAWWIAWSPFVGLFIARVSRGRTVRQFMLCVLIAPTLVSCLWVSVFGGVAIEQVLTDANSLVRANVIDSYDLPIALFSMLQGLPLATFTSVVSIFLIVVFFVTSSDSGSLVIDSITAGGKTSGPMPQRIFWCMFQGAVAIVLLLGGGLEALQAMAISIGLPFTLVLILMCFAIARALSEESAKKPKEQTTPPG